MHAPGDALVKPEHRKRLALRSSMDRDPPDTPAPKVRPITVAAFSGYPAFGIAAVCKCSLRTAQQWKNGTRRPSAAALALWELHRDEQVLTREFRGFAVRGGKIVDPRGKTFTVSQLIFFEHIIQYASDLARRLGPEEYDRFWGEIMRQAG